MTRLPRSLFSMHACIHARELQLHRLVLQIVIARANLLHGSRIFFKPSAPLTDRKNSCGGRASCILKYSRTWCRRTKNIQDPLHLVETDDALQLFIYIRRTFTRLCDAKRRVVLSFTNTHAGSTAKALYYTWYSFTVFARSAYFYFALKDLRCIDVVRI